MFDFLNEILDFNGDGKVSSDEVFTAYQTLKDDDDLASDFDSDFDELDNFDSDF